jgi:solute carrier family 20 (sodium-dependent phosphate transporter)
MYGMMCALFAAGIWLALATFLELPVSTTHSIVGAVVGMSVVAQGPSSVNWSSRIDSFPYLSGLSAISLSWVFSPLLSGLLAMILFLFTRHAVLRRKNSYELSLWLLPLYTFLTFFVIVYFIIKKGGQAFGWQKTPDSKAAWIAAVFGACCMILSMAFGVKYVRYASEKTMKEMEEAENAKKEAAAAKQLAIEKGVDAAKINGDQAGSSSIQIDLEGAEGLENAHSVAQHRTPELLISMRRSRVWKTLTDGSNVNIHDVIETDEKIHDIHAHSERFDTKTELSFKYLQVFTACANSFAHGSNDVANSIGPLAAVYGVWVCTCVNTKSTVPQWILVLGGFGIVVGLATYGYKIMRVLGVKMTRLTNSRGYCVELAAAAIVIISSRYGLPVSTTHCMVGAVSGIGILEGSRGFNAILLLKFFAGWVATLIVSGLTAAAFTAQGVYSPSRDSTVYRANLNAGFNVTNVGMSNTLLAAGNVTAPTPAQAAATLAGQMIVNATKLTWNANNATILDTGYYMEIFQGGTYALGNASQAGVIVPPTFMPIMPNE